MTLCSGGHIISKAGTINYCNYFRPDSCKVIRIRLVELFLSSLLYGRFEEKTPTSPGYLKKFGVLGADVLLYRWLYSGFGVKGAWHAGVDNIIRKLCLPSCFSRKSIALVFCKYIYTKLLVCCKMYYSWNTD